VFESFSPLRTGTRYRETRHFYSHVVGCTEGRKDRDWIDFDLYGHQFVCHLNPLIGKTGTLVLHTTTVDWHHVPVPPFGVVLKMRGWASLARSLHGKGVEFLIETCARFLGQFGEPPTLFFLIEPAMLLNSRAFGILQLASSIPAAGIPE